MSCFAQDTRTSPPSSSQIVSLDSRIGVAYLWQDQCPTSTALIKGLINPLIDLQCLFSVEHLKGRECPGKSSVWSPIDTIDMPLPETRTGARKS